MNWWYPCIQAAGGGICAPICPIAPIAIIAANGLAAAAAAACCALCCPGGDAPIGACLTSHGLDPLDPAAAAACANPAAAMGLPASAAIVAAAAFSPSSMPAPAFFAAGTAPWAPKPGGMGMDEGLNPVKAGIPAAKAMERPPGMPAGGFEATSGALAGSAGASETMSKRLLRRLRLLRLFWRMKYFCACEATCVGVRDCTKWREMPRQSPCGWMNRMDGGGGVSAGDRGCSG